MSHEHSADDTSHLRRNLAVGAAGLAASGAAAGYLAYRKHRLEQQRRLNPENAELYERNVRIFDEPHLTLQQRQLMASVAAAVYIADSNTDEPVINRKELRGIMHDTTSTEGALNDAVWYLKRADVIEHRNKILNPKSHGYALLPSLMWAMESMESPPDLLIQAHSDLLQQLSDNS
jgi:hypothetical protein